MASAVVRVRVGNGGARGPIVVVADEVPADLDATAGAEAAAEIRVVVVDARVDDSHAHAGAVEPQLFLRHVGSGHLQGGGQIDAAFGDRLSRDDVDGVERDDPGNPRELAQVPGVDLDGDPVPQIVEG